jgi:hypothetical protein
MDSLAKGPALMSAIPTSGPWEIHWPKFGADIVSAHGFVIAHVTVTPDPETEANVALLGAALSLLEALKATMALWGSNAPHDFDVCEDSTCTCVRQQALKAIAKAEGR